MRTRKLKILYTEQLDILNAASASVWRECLDLQEVWCYAHGSWGYFPCIKSRGIGTIVIGDLTGIRENINYSKRTNQKLHQWAFGKVRQLITYKAKALGIKVEVIDESYTSQTCPSCGNRYKPNNREYKCKCGFTYHRDGVGAINIRRKYLGHFGVPVGATMVSPVGLRLEVRCCSA